MSIKLLDAVTSATVSDAYSPQDALNDHTVQIIVTGGPTDVVGKLCVSLDGQNYCVIGTYTMTAAEIAHGCGIYHTPGYRSNHIKLELATLSGGISPTVTALYQGGT